MVRPFSGYQQFYPVTLSLEFDLFLFLKNLNLANIFLTDCARALIFHMSILCDNTFPWVPVVLTL